jgi:hypothetical protein
MVTLRDARGKIIELPSEVRFIEFRDASGKVARLLILKNDGSVMDVVSGTKEAEVYGRNFNVQFCPIIDITDQLELE